MSTRTAVLIEEDQALDQVRDGMTIAIGGFNTAAHPMVIVRGLIRRGVRRLRVIGGTIAGLELDLLIGAGVVEEVITSSVTGEALASIGPFFREAAESGAVRVWESDEGILYAGLRAAGQGLPFLPWKAGVGTSLPEVNPDLKRFVDPICGEELLAVPALRPDVAFIHVGRADVYGLGQHIGSGFGDRMIHRAADKTILTTERIVSNETIRSDPYRTSIAYADGVVRAPWGAHPFSSPGHYLVDEEHLHEYLDAAASARKGDRTAFDDYLGRYVHGPQSHAGYLEAVGLRRLLTLDEL
ncbi:MAG TPA: CoA-transferase [Solirubrobacteraceae bacterium]|jgi:glutaconate CoA-transferase subunit A|nr:CoA-transferase [Solirubrobacteraceae bacterium]